MINEEIAKPMYEITIKKENEELSVFQKGSLCDEYKTLIESEKKLVGRGKCAGVHIALYNPGGIRFDY